MNPAPFISAHRALLKTVRLAQRARPVSAPCPGQREVQRALTALSGRPSDGVAFPTVERKRNYARMAAKNGQKIVATVLKSYGAQ
jgi:hypothetical protein